MRSLSSRIYLDLNLLLVMSDQQQVAAIDYSDCQRIHLLDKRIRAHYYLLARLDAEPTSLMQAQFFNKVENLSVIKYKRKNVATLINVYHL